MLSLLHGHPSLCTLYTHCGTFAAPCREQHRLLRCPMTHCFVLMNALILQYFPVYNKACERQHNRAGSSYQRHRSRPFVFNHRVERVLYCSYAGPSKHHQSFASVSEKQIDSHLLFFAHNHFSTPTLINTLRLPSVFSESPYTCHPHYLPQHRCFEPPPERVPVLRCIKYRHLFKQR